MTKVTNKNDGLAKARMEAQKLNRRKGKIDLDAMEGLTDNIQEAAIEGLVVIIESVRSQDENIHLYEEAVDRRFTYTI